MIYINIFRSYIKYNKIIKVPRKVNVKAMKIKGLCVLGILALHLLTACGRETQDNPVISSLDQKLAELQAENGELRAETEELQAENQKLQAETEGLQAENQELAETLQNLQSALKQIAMQPEGSDGREILTKQYMAGECAEIYKVPTELEELKNRNLSYVMVYPCAIVTDGKPYPSCERWVLVTWRDYAESLDTVGWVKLEDLVEYTEETRNLLKSPLYVAEEAINLETGEAVDSLFTQGAWVNMYEDYAEVYVEGGISCRVNKKYIRYPEVRD